MPIEAKFSEDTPAETDADPFVAALAVPVLPNALPGEETLDEVQERSGEDAEPSSVPLRPPAFDETHEETIARGRRAAAESPGGFWPTGEEIAAMPRPHDAAGNVTAIGPDLDADHRHRFDAFKRSSRAARRTSPILRRPAPRIVGCHSRERRATPTRSRGSRRGTAARSSADDPGESDPALGGVPACPSNGASA